MPPRSRGLTSSIRSIQRSTHSNLTARGPSLLRSTLPLPAARTRTFHSSLPLAKKDKSKSSGSKKGAAPSENTSPSSSSSPDDPYDFSALESGIAKAVEWLQDALSKTRNAGRVSIETVEGLSLELPGGAGRAKVGNVATVVAKGGRSMQVFCGDEGHLKPILTAIQSSPHSLVPSPDAQNPLLLNLPIPPATAETRALAAAEAKKSLERAGLDVRTARGDAQKRHRQMELKKTVVKDELRKAHEAMEKVAKKGMDEVQALYEAALKGLER